jgi:hypothetical protein
MKYRVIWDGPQCFRCLSLGVIIGAILTAIVATLLGGCSTIEPNSVRVYTEHVSHISQHFGSDASNFGYEEIAVEAHYQMGHAFLNISEGYNLSPGPDGGIKMVGVERGALAGPREAFQAQAGYEFALK